MTNKELASTVSYCGLLCGVCIHPCEGRGCKSGGGLEGCVHRECCVERKLEGCWECPDFPCEKGFFGEKAWRGLNIGCAETIKEKGIEVYVSLVTSSFGDPVDYGDYRFKDPNEIKILLIQPD